MATKQEQKQGGSPLQVKGREEWWGERILKQEGKLKLEHHWESALLTGRKP